MIVDKSRNTHQRSQHRTQLRQNPWPPFPHFFTCGTLSLFPNSPPLLTPLAFVGQSFCFQSPKLLQVLHHNGLVEPEIQKPQLIVSLINSTNILSICFVSDIEHQKITMNKTVEKEDNKQEWRLDLISLQIDAMKEINGAICQPLQTATWTTAVGEGFCDR